MTLSDYATDRLKTIKAFIIAIGIIGVIVLVIYGAGHCFVHYVWVPTHNPPPRINQDEFGFPLEYYDDRYAVEWSLYLGTLCVSGIIIIDYKGFKIKNKEGTQ